MLNILLEKVLSGQEISKNEAVSLIHEKNLEALLEASHTITQKMASKSFDLCSIINSKSGNCSADCKWCAQSARAKCKIETYPLVDADTCLEHALYNEKKGVHRFSLVNSGKAPNNKEIDDLVKIFSYLKLNTKINLCASIGLADEKQLKKLYEAGVKRCHCNLETSKSFFSKLCTTHTQEDKIKTLKAAEKAGMDLCSGGIIGMGESFDDRIEMAMTLRELKVKSVPINILHPIEGTPLEGQELLKADEILRTIAIFRFILPSAFLRLAGGRSLMSKDTVEKALYAGINSAITGDLLTTTGSSIDEDIQMVKKAGYSLN